MIKIWLNDDLKSPTAFYHLRHAFVNTLKTLSRSNKQMERQIPDVWNIFALSGSTYNRDESKRTENGIHVNWSQRNQDLLNRWCDR